MPDQSLTVQLLGDDAVDARSIRVVLGLTAVEISIEDRSTADVFIPAFSSLATLEDPVHDVRIRTDRDGHLLIVDDVEIHRSPHVNEVIDNLVGWCNRTAVLSLTEPVNLHAAGLVEPRSGRLVVVVGTSGSGKTTTSLEAVAAGWGYLSDELVSLWPDGAVSGYPKPLTVKSGGAQATGLELGPWTTSDAQRRWYVPPSAIGGHILASALPHAILFPTFDAEAPEARIRHLGHAEALLELTLNCHDDLDAQGRALESLGRLAVGAHPCAITQSKPSSRGLLNVLSERDPVPSRAVRSVRAQDPGGSRRGPHQAPGVVSVDCGDGAVLHQPATSGVALLDGVGAQVWALLDGSRTTTEVVGMLADRFSEPRAHVDRDVTRLLDELRAQELVVLR